MAWQHTRKGTAAVWVKFGVGSIEARFADDGRPQYTAHGCKRKTRVFPSFRQAEAYLVAQPKEQAWAMIASPKRRWTIIGTQKGKPCHWEVTSVFRRALWCSKHRVTFEDRTQMRFTVKAIHPSDPAKPGIGAGEYTSLINDCVRFGTGNVAELERRQKAAEKRGDVVPEDPDR